MTASRPSSRYVTDGRGQRIAVILDLERCEHVLDTAEELADIRALDEVRLVLSYGRAQFRAVPDPRG
ncbi:MAG: hypothetical protein AAF970_20300 [Bacteroidota bacterium]